MSPEQARGRSVDARADVWAFGVVLVEMVTGRRVFNAETMSDTMAAVLTREPDLDGVPRALRRLARACLVKDPAGRLRHIGDAMMLVDETVAAPAAAGRMGPPRLVWTTALVLTAVTVALIAWLLLRPQSATPQITRFLIDAPPAAAFNYTYTAAAISPDGRQVVFRVATSAGAPALWLRPLDSLEARAIPGTDRADFPFWSADGRSVAFFATGRLERVDVGGGAPIVICDASDADTATTGGAWNQTGAIIFGAPQGLYRVSASGGTPSLILAVNGADRETGVGFPQFLPDGDRFLIFVRSDDAAHQGMYVSSLSHPDRKTLVLSTNRKALVVADANRREAALLYLQDRTLLARRLDLSSLALTGEPISIATNVALFPPGFHASFWISASGSVLAYRTESSDRPRLTWVSADATVRRETGQEDFYTQVRLSPDGTRAVVELTEDQGIPAIWTWDFARRVKTRQTFNTKPDRFPIWAPTGDEIAFASLRDGALQIYRKNLRSGQSAQALTTGPGDKTPSDWSRDGRYILYTQNGAMTSEDIWALPVAGDGQPFPVLQTPAIETTPALSPDGQWLAFESALSGRPEVYVTRFLGPASHAEAPGQSWQVSTQGGSRPRWSGDGRALFFAALDDRSIQRAAVRAVGAGFESDPPARFAELTLMSVARSPFDVSADGRRVLLLERTINQAAPLVVVTNALLSAGR
jgi:Tol biopolymer transport system component